MRHNGTLVGFVSISGIMEGVHAHFDEVEAAAKSLRRSLCS